MGRKKQTTDTYGLEPPEVIPKKIKNENSKEYIIKIEQVEFTDENLGFVIANLRFYKFDARGYDHPGRKPFKIYETSWELGTCIRKKIAEFETAREQEAAFIQIIEEYSNVFKTKYKLTKRKSNEARRKNSSFPVNSSVSDGSSELSKSDSESSDSSSSLSSDVRE